MDHEELNRLLILLQKGDRSALEALYREFSVPFYTLVTRITKDPALSEDILHDFFVKLFQSPPAAPLRSPKAYLYRMLRNLTIDTLRKQKDPVSLEESIPSGEDLSALAAERLDLSRAMDALAPADREILSLHLNGGLTFREIAEITKRPLGTVLWRYHQSLRILRELLNGGTR